MKKRVWPVVLAAAVGMAILCSLGVWQVKRLAWKEALIAQLHKQAQAAPLPISPAHLSFDLGPPPNPVAEYQRLTATGHFSNQPPFRMMASANGMPGWRLIQPFEADGFQVLVDRGVVSVDQAIDWPKSEITVTGVARFHKAGHSLFDPVNDSTGNRWFWWDMNSLRHMTPGQELNTVRYALQLEPGSPGTDGLFVAAPKAELRNNHLGYAITWFGLAAALAAVAGVFVWRKRNSS